MIRDYFSEDHREIDGIFSRLLAGLAQSQGASEAPDSEIAKGFHNLDERLDRHIRWEEELLFPAIEEKAPDLVQGPGRVMRMEHTEIRACLRKARETIAAGGLGNDGRQAIQSALLAAEAILVDHNEKEETIYYPLCDELFSHEEASLLLDRIRKAQ